MRAIYNGFTLAQSGNTIVVEGYHYFPLESVDPNVLRRNHIAFWNGVQVAPD